MPHPPMPPPPPRRTSRPVLAALLLIALSGALGWGSPRSWAQLVVVDDRYYVTELQPAHHRIGISEGRDFKTRTWVDIEPRTRIATTIHHGKYSRAIDLTPREMFSTLKPGMKVHVHGGRDWDQHIVARKIWF